MAGRFQRLDNSEDIVSSPEIVYTSQYYDEPQNIFNSSAQRKMSHTTRKPVAGTSPPPQNVLSPQPRYQSFSATQPLYQTQSNPEQPLIDNYFHGTPRLAESPSMGSVQSGYTDPNRPKKDSLITRARAAVVQAARGQHVSHVATPLWAAPWRHQPCVDVGDTKYSTVRFFDRVKQRNRIFFHFFLQWLLPLIFCVALVGTLYFYSAKKQISKREKYIFNSFVVGFSLCLGFAVLDGMKGYASILRWRLLARRYRSLQEFELLLGLSSQKKALRLMWVGRTEGSILPNGTQILCFCYLILMVGLQIGIALLGLTYSVDTALLQHSIQKNSNVSISNLSYFYQNNFIPLGVTPFQAQSGTINNYGVTGQLYGVTYQQNTTLMDVDDATAVPLYTDNSTAWWFRFYDQCPEPQCTTSYISNRRVISQAKCQQYTITAGGFTTNKSVTYLDELGRKLTWAYKGSELSASTTWYGNTAETCGPRCTTIYSLNVGLTSNNFQLVAERPQFFQCNNTISEVENTAGLSDAEAYQMPDEQARLLAGAIGYNGANYSQSTNGTYQARTYDTGSLWSWNRLEGQQMSPEDVANVIMHFSVSAIAGYDFIGYRRFVIGDTPIPAQKVNVEWKYSIAILIAIPSIQFLVLMIAVIWGNAAIVRDDSFLSAAALLRPVVQQLERSGCALTSDEICEVLGNPNVAYGVRMPQGSAAYGGMMKGHDDVMHLDIISEHENQNPHDMGWRVGMKMPQGRYDGFKEWREHAETTATNLMKKIESRSRR